MANKGNMEPHISKPASRSDEGTGFIRQKSRQFPYKRTIVDHIRAWLVSPGFMRPLQVAIAVMLASLFTFVRWDF